MDVKGFYLLGNLIAGLWFALTLFSQWAQGNVPLSELPERISHMQEVANRGYLGMLGAVLTAAGALLPCVTFHFLAEFTFSFVSAMREDSHIPALVIMFIALAVAFLFFLFGYRGGNWLGALLLVFLLFAALADHNGISTEFFNHVRYGYWLMLIGCGMMILSPYAKGINTKIGACFFDDSAHSNKA